MQESTLNSRIEKIAFGSPVLPVSGLASTVPSKAIFCMVEGVMIICTKCNQKKSLEDFYRNQISKDGRRGQCKACRRIYQRLDKYKSTSRRYRQTDKGKASHRKANYRYSKSDKGRKTNLKSVEEYKKKNPLKVCAKNKALHAIKIGKLTRGPCEVCGSIVNVAGHHDDYDKPLDVRWLCHKHHDNLHRWKKQAQGGNNGSRREIFDSVW